MKTESFLELFITRTESEFVISKTEARIDRVLGFASCNFRREIRLSEVADYTCLSVPAFCNFFKAHTGDTFTNVVNRLRIGFAKRLLEDTEWSVMKIAFESGFATPANFHRQFKKFTGISPLQFRLLKSRSRHLEASEFVLRTKLTAPIEAR